MLHLRSRPQPNYRLDDIGPEADLPLAPSAVSAAGDAAPDVAGQLWLPGEGATWTLHEVTTPPAPAARVGFREAQGQQEPTL